MLLSMELIGRVGSDPEAHNAANGRPYCRFSVAINERWNDKTTGERKEKTTWVSIVAFGAIANFCLDYLGKGALVFVRGTPEARHYVNRDGETRSSLNLTVRELKSLSSGRQNDESRAQTASPPAARPVAASQSLPIDDIPF